MEHDTLPTAKAPFFARPAMSRAQAQGAALGLLLAGMVFAMARTLDPTDSLAPTVMAVGLFLASGALALHAMTPMGFANPEFGAPNAVTLLRLALVCTMAVGLVRDELLTETGLVVFAIAVLALALDGLDGWLARRSGLWSPFGARFDMEVDAALGCMLSLVLMVAGRAGPEILILGFSRYAFRAAGQMLPWLRAPLPDRLGRKAVCVVQIGALCLLLLPGLPPPLARGIALSAAGLLLWSFGRDILYLARQR